MGPNHHPAEQQNGAPLSSWFFFFMGMCCFGCLQVLAEGGHKYCQTDQPGNHSQSNISQIVNISLAQISSVVAGSSPVQSLLEQQDPRKLARRGRAAAATAAAAAAATTTTGLTTTTTVTTTAISAVHPTAHRALK